MTLIAKLENLTDTQKSIVFNDAKKAIRIYDYQQYRWLTFGGSAIQAVIDKNNPCDIISYVIKNMINVLRFIPEPKNTLVLGSGVGSIEKGLLVYDSDLQISSVEPSQDIIKVSHTFFQLPKNITAMQQTAQDYLSIHNGNFDIIFCDIFANEKHPACLLDKNYYQGVKNNLSAKGIFVINLLGEDEQELLQIMLLIRQIFKYTAITPVLYSRNIVFYASEQKLEIEPIKKLSFLDILGDTDISVWREQVKLLPSLS